MRAIIMDAATWLMAIGFVTAIITCSASMLLEHGGKASPKLRVTLLTWSIVGLSTAIISSSVFFCLLYLTI